MACRTKQTVLLLGLAVLGLTACNFPAGAEPFDKPLRKKIVDLGQSQLLLPSATEHVKLTCSYYPKFMVKQVDDPGNKGALFIAIVPIRASSTVECVGSHHLGEKVFKKWDGYFAGVKRNLVFLRDSDGTNGGLPFTAFDSRTRKRVFRDSVLLSDKPGELDFVESSDTQITLKFVRVVSGNCSIPKEGSACWGRFKEQMGLPLAPAPTCSYESSSDREAPSVIAYPVEVSFFPAVLTKALANPIKCWPAD